MCRSDDLDDADDRADRGADQGSDPSAPHARWVRIRGQSIDVSNFEHPGGSVIKFFHGLDGTAAFQSFHGHSKAAQYTLLSLPALDLPEDEAACGQPEAHAKAMMEAVASWRLRGLFQPRPLATAAYGAIVVGAVALSVALAPARPVAAGLLCGVAWAHCGFLQHMGGHYSMGSHSIAWQHFFEGLLKGGSASWWRGRHNKHHAKTNVIGEDGDLRTTPFFAWDPTLARLLPDWSLRTQAFTFLPALAAYVFVFAFTVRKYALLRRAWVEFALMLAHYALFAAALAAAGCSPREGAAFYAVGYAAQGVYLGFFFGLSHFAAERVPRTASWLQCTMHGTLNWSGSSALAGYASGFLNVQIEHHMAPQMPMQNLRLIRDDCRAIAAAHGLPYRELSFGAAVRHMLGGLHATGRAELARRADRERFSAAGAYAAAAGAVLGDLKAD
jgi:fatty acid desaturase